MALVQTEIPVELHAKLKMICTLKRISVRQQLRELIEEFVRKEEAEGKFGKEGE